MSIAMLASPAAWAPFHDFLRWFGPGGKPSVLRNLAEQNADEPLVVGRQSGAPAFLRKHHTSRMVPRVQTGTQPNPQPGTLLRTPGSALSCLAPQRKQGLPMVRVVRVHEAGLPRANVGRMVISGRMADVCAELDRLVAKEAVLH